MRPGSLVVIGCNLSPEDVLELRAAGQNVPRIGRDVYEIKSGPYLTVNDGKSYTAVTFQETGDIEWNTAILLEVAEPEKVDIQALMENH